MGDFVLKISEDWQSKRIWFYASLVLLLGLLILGTSIRTSNIDSLIDVTTNEYTLGPDLDPFLFLRVAGEIVEHGKPLDPDNMRYLGLADPYQNFVPYGIAYLYKFMSFFSSDASLTYAAIIFPVIFFGLSILAFFFFIREIFYRKSEFQKSLTAVVATAFYSVIPLLQHRTTAGIPELESAGILFFWLSFFLILKAWNSSDEKLLKIKRGYVFAFLAGLTTVLMIFTWGGFRFILYSIALATLIAFFLGKIQKKETIIYSLWFVPTILFLIFKSGFSNTLFSLTTGLIPLFVFFVLIADLFLGKTIFNQTRKIIKKEIPQEVSVFVFVILFGFILMLILKPSFALGIAGELIDRLTNPFGDARVGVTVAENRPLYVVDSIGSFGKAFFWMFFFGTILLFYEAIKNTDRKEKMVLMTSFSIFVTGFLFSRYSPQAEFFNGSNFISNTVYFGVLILLLVSVLWAYFRNVKSKQGLEKLKSIEFSYLLLLSLLILMMVASRGAIRLLVISSPVFVIAVAFFIVAMLMYWLNSKEEFWKLILGLIFFVSLVFSVMTFMTYQSQTSQTVEATAPHSSTVQWQQAMSWVRENTGEDSLFVHWWDYGYWVQTIGQRPTVTDGGHAFSYWDHLIGRYLLTTPVPETALSLFKSYGVDYLLIDPTDLGKYGAYSSIGSDENGSDRLAQIPIMVLNPSQTKTSNESRMRLYQGAAGVDEDIIYNLDGKEIFIPQGRGAIGGIIIETSESSTSLSFNQPKGVFIYNNQQINIPIRYLYFQGEIIEFDGGLDAVVRVVPSLNTAGQTVQVDNLGTVIYLSPKVKDGLFAQLYLMDDPFDNYPTIRLVHSQLDQVVQSLRSQGAGINDFVFFQGFRGPIKIWDTGNIPENILERDEFLRTSGSFGEFDDLEFSR
ncbi:MAG: STT3 domain-containing protein [Candidatus Pacearchaeota archaeon]